MPNYIAKAISNVQVLVVDDEPAIADFVDEVLTENGYHVAAYSDPLQALIALKTKTFDLALVDINMPQISGVELSQKITQSSPHTEIIIITGVPDEKNLDPCLKMGLTHFLFKPFNESQLVYTVYAALHFKRLRNAYVSSTTAKIKGSGLVGVSMSTRDIREEVVTIASMNIPVLILGNTGTGKEVIARDIHNNSSRFSKTFVSINCAVLGSLAGSELFGHVSGAFTGASKSTKGYIGSADGGTLFFDEVGELPLEIQAQLLRFLDNGEYNRVGDAATTRADVRILAATNKNLEEMCHSGAFREDLYYRISGSVIKTTPLDDRKADILPLIWHFLELFGTAQNKTYDISSDAASLMIEAEWPGNVRQLKQTLYKISQISSSRKITAPDVRRVLGGIQDVEILTYKQAKERTVNEFDREYLLKTIGLAQGSLKEALRLSGMHKKNFYVKIKQFGIVMKDFTVKKN
ncbi:MAG: sigma-54-dependent Fis family transcriptional regulator [Desulfobulbaceae bacterium]|nr:sigma-54-dependent Fis family transcriptional regulator [Desulfobulbaceae bacterium]